MLEILGNKWQEPLNLVYSNKRFHFHTSIRSSEVAAFRSGWIQRLNSEVWAVLSTLWDSLPAKMVTMQTAELCGVTRQEVTERV